MATRIDRIMPGEEPAYVNYNGKGIGPYDSSEDWDSYIERLEEHFDSCNIQNLKQQRSVLTSTVGKETYGLMKNLLGQNEKPKDKTFKELVDLVSSHKNPTPPWQSERLKFLNRNRDPDRETVVEYAAELKNLAATCDFTPAEYDSRIRDRLMHGIGDADMQLKMVEVGKDMTFKTGLEAAVKYEATVKSVRDMKDGQNSSSSHATASASGGAVNKVVKQGRCWMCGGSHEPHTCKFKHELCYSCNSEGHIRSRCPDKGKKSYQKKDSKSSGNSGAKPFYKSKKGKPKSKSQHHLEEDDDSCGEYSLYHMPFKGEGRKPIMVDILVNGKELTMEVDTGATFSVIGSETADSLGAELQPSELVLKTYGAESLKVMGKIVCSVQYEGQKLNDMVLFVVPGCKPALLGRDWMGHIKLNWQKIVSVFHVGETLGVKMSNTWQEKYPRLFEDSLGKLEGYKATIRLKQGAVPKFCKAASVPYAIKEELGRMIQKQEKLGVWEKVDYSEWASRTVNIRKPDNSLRICGDYKTTINPVMEVDQYPLPTPEDLFAKLSGGVMFTVIDLSHAYEQVELTEDSKMLMVLNTHMGLYKVNRLTYGPSCAVAIFQNIMEGLIGNVPHTGIYLDDVIITGKTQEEHDQNVNEVLKRLNDANLRLKLQKCSFGKDEVQYLGFKVSAEGIAPLTDKLRALVEAPAPENESELRSLLGMVQYYSRFLPNLSSELEPLHELLRTPTEWSWKSRQNTAFKNIKSLLLKAPVLAHYDVTKPLAVSCDASPYGLGAVLSHITDDGVDQPIAFASRKLAPAERNYSQLDKEGLAVVFAMKKFHKYISGRPVTVFTDHKPLLGLLGEGKAIPQHASPRVQRWAITLAGYDYKLVYKKGSLNGNADCLSRLPLPVAPSTVPIPPEIHRVVQQVDATLSLVQIRAWTQKDPVLSRVYEYVMTGWPAHCDDEDLQPYFNRRSEISVEDGVLMWGVRVIIPRPGREAVLQELHEVHPGVTCMKALARSCVYWPGIDQQIEDQVKNCTPCQVNRKEPAAAPLHPWEWPAHPWFRVHADYAGPFMGKMFLILVDAHSKWIECHVMSSSSTEATIEKMEQSFATLGLPVYLVTDNGSCFTSSEFQSFMKANGIHHITSAPYHPASNGLAE